MFEEEVETYNTLAHTQHLHKCTQHFCMLRCTKRLSWHWHLPSPREMWSALDQLYPPYDLVNSREFLRYAAINVQASPALTCSSQRTHSPESRGLWKVQQEASSHSRKPIVYCPHHRSRLNFQSMSCCSLMLEQRYLANLWCSHNL